MTDRTKTIWVTRAQPGADATAVRVRALGHEPLVVPLLAVRRVEDATVDLNGVAALAFTSANGVRAFADLSPDRQLKVFAVGAATAQAARAVGFRRVLSSDGDVAGLSEGIAARRAELKGAVLHPGAAEPAGDLAGTLAVQGVEIRALTLYDTAPVELTEAELARVAAADAVLLHSPKAAQVLAAILRNHPMEGLRALCLSKAVMKPFAKLKLAGKAFAPFPLEAALLNLIDRTP
jgi:uroporphyrinogen-III synthase